MPRKRIVVHVEGGLVQGVFFEDEEGAEVLVIDTDTCDDPQMAIFKKGRGGWDDRLIPMPCYLNEKSVDLNDTVPAGVTLYNPETFGLVAPAFVEASFKASE